MRQVARRAPSCNLRLSRPVTPPQPSELQIHIAVAEHLRYRARRGLVWWHTPNGEKRDKASAAKLKAMGVTPGVPDLILIADGKTYGLELKTASGRLSPGQRGMLDRFAEAGAYTAVAYGIDSALSILSAWGLIRCDQQLAAA